MYRELNGKVALVTGATRGFGRAIALRLASEGAHVLVSYRRSKTDAGKVVEQIRSSGGSSEPVRCDVGSETSQDKLFDYISSSLGRLEILIANAAFGVPGKLIESTRRYWDVTMWASAWSLIGLAQRMEPLCRKGWGRIVSITSDGGQRVLPGYGVVGPAKAALESVTRGLSSELAGKGIRVNGILAGLSDTRSFRSIPGADRALAHAKMHTPTGRIVLPEDIANAAVFLCSNQAEMICGHFIVVDGGRNIMG